jgi:hypothetical protein
MKGYSMEEMKKDYGSSSDSCQSLILTSFLCQYACRPVILLHQIVNLGNVPVGNTSASTLTITNRGNSDLSINSVTITGTNAPEFSQTNGCTTIPANGSCAVTVTFAPAAPYGKKSAAMSIVSNDPRRPTVNVKLSGQAPPPKISASPMSVNLGSTPVGSASAPRTVTVRNTGLSDLAITALP